MFVEAFIMAASLAFSPSPATSGALEPVAPPMTLGASVPAPIGYLRFCRRRPDQCQQTLADDHSDGQTSGPLASPTGDDDLKPTSILSPPSGDARQDADHAGPGTGFDLPQLQTSPAATGDIGPLQGSEPSFSLGLTSALWTTLNAVNRGLNDQIKPMSDESAFGVANYWTLPIEDEHRSVGNCKHYALEKRKALVDAGVPASALSLAIARTSSGELHAVLILATRQGEYVLDNLSWQIKPWKDVHYRWLARQLPGQPLAWASVL